MSSRSIVRKSVVFVVCLVIISSFAAFTGSTTSAASAPKGTKITKLSCSGNTVTVKWKKQPKKISGYQIQYCTNKKFKSAKKLKIKNPGRTSLKVKGLKKGKKYWFRIRTYREKQGRKIYSDWSMRKSVKIPASGAAYYKPVLKEYRDYMKKVDAGGIDAGNFDEVFEALGYRYVSESVAEAAVFNPRGGSDLPRPEYAYKDINDDGVKEMVIGGKIDGNHYIGTIFTLNKKKKPVELINCFSYMYREYVYIFQDGTVEDGGSGGADIHAYRFYKLKPDASKLIPVKEFEQNGDQYTKNGKTMSEDDFWPLVHEMEGAKKMKLSWKKI